MWKYVSRRLKDSLEKTTNIIDCGRSRFCSSSGLCEVNPDGQQQQAQKDSPKKDVLLFKKRGCYMSRFVARNRCSSRKQRQQDEEKAGHERERERLNYQQSWLGAITWSSAIICGWYTSQYICLRRKRMGWTVAGPGQEGNNNKCVYAGILLNTSRSLHTNVSSRIAYAAPPYPGSGPSYVPSSALGALLQNVNNPHDDEISSKVSESLTLDSGISKSSDRSSSTSSTTVESAVAEFSSAIGEIEYQFGVQDLMAKDYRSAVNHLRMATTHHHSGATFNLGLCYEQGLGVDRDLKRAVECYQVASSLGHPKAMYNLGVFYVRGWGGLKRSRKAARQCFDLAARLGQQEAQVAMEVHRVHQQQEQQRLEPKLISAWANEAGFGVKAF